MKFVSFLHDGEVRAGVLDKDEIILLEGVGRHHAHSLSDLIKSSDNLSNLGQSHLKRSDVTRIKASEVEFAPVIHNPGKVICLGLNYFDHAKEGGREKPTYPWFFMRAASSLMGHKENSILPKVSTHLDYEAELAVVIGKKCKHVSRDNALDYVFGYSCFNDISVRDYQKKTPQWTIGKNFDATGAFGPYLVTTDEIPAGGRGLRIQCRLNDEIVQDANTSDMIFHVEETIELISECMTLDPGDVIVMGTPAGVGFARTPQLWLKNGDLVEVDIEHVGVLSNRVVLER
jgi:2-keto-4-pentenoate hydratase/2-oxohepta-3-ene-1,7-dioic acid hydratase in catechol pathway